MLPAEIYAHVLLNVGHNQHFVILKIVVTRLPNMQDGDLESVILPNKEGQKFLCYLPKVTQPKNVIPVAQHNSSSMIMETEKRISLKTPDELLEGLNDICLLRVSANSLLTVFPSISRLLVFRYF